MKRFNTTGVCISKKHYMVDISHKIEQIEKLIENEFYFVINRPRQYGKTTTLFELYKKLKFKYEVIRMSFEGIMYEFESEERFCKSFLGMMRDYINIENIESVTTISELASLIKRITKDKEIILIIDEVDRAADNKLFLNFLAMLRSLYLDRDMEVCRTFKSVVLAGVHDIKNLKLKFRDEEVKYNSPWNIAVDFDIDMSFNEFEIESMLDEYSSANNLGIDCPSISSEIYKFTEGYPFLVSRICQIVDEKILGVDKKTWTTLDIYKAIKILLLEKNTLFDDLIKNLENNKGLYKFIYEILVRGDRKVYNPDNPVIDIGSMFGYLTKDGENNVDIASQIVKERIYNYMVSKTDIEKMSSYNFKDNFITKDNGLDMERVLLKFQQFMKENYSTRDLEFLERHGVLLFLAFIKPIINGTGFEYKEVQISEEKRLDIVIQYNNYKYIIETKIWHGNKAHEKGKYQLQNYLEIEGLEKGYLLIFNFNKEKNYTTDEYKVENKTIFEVRV